MLCPIINTAYVCLRHVIRHNLRHSLPPEPLHVIPHNHRHATRVVTSGNEW